LASLPKEPQEAAIIDGANWFQILIYITTALMKPIIMVAVLMRVILAFRTYDLIYVMTKGGPGTSTDIISYFIYKKTFMGLDLSQASAISYLLLLVVMIIVVILFRQMVKNDE
jgi:multiple sugar transport system permease protein